MTNLKDNIDYFPLTLEYFSQVITLANLVHGEGYLDIDKLVKWTDKGTINNINCSFVAVLDNKVIGFRSTYSANTWQIDQWCSPDLWQVDSKKCCYFKCNTVDEKHRGLGIGKQLLKLAIEAAKKQGAQAGISHLWKQSPNNSAVSYFTKCGGKLITSHPDKWNEESKQGYNCILCGHDCHCEAAEMIIYFDS
ncbi:GNAT family N-acetyltransferase [Colwellia psychrerythraea]|uniref:GCN5-related N-acetyltransferase n=1 Tax=Colwellia psychrerythraea TaxID=28229 RepID=A0A099KJX1_COLPS|nr:GNAT family N-acetyltransferase [Colwellia psychrerythraea]KGJ90676.1 GCN5-related N-acetyltransferase [Colwellia psychrerythraea]